MVSGSVVVDSKQVSRLMRDLNTFTSPASLSAYMVTVASPRLVKEAESRFTRKGDNASGKWAPLSQSTQEIRTSLGFSPNDINVRTGRLRDYVIQPSPVIAEDIGGTVMRWPGRPAGDMTRRLRQAAGRGRGPARWVVAFDAGTVAYLVRTLNTWIMRDGRR